MTSTTTTTRIKTSANAPTVRPMASPTPLPERAGVAAAGTHDWPFQRHKRSCEYAGLQVAPSHPQNPSGENRLPAGGGWGAPGVWGEGGCSMGESLSEYRK